MAFPQLYVKPFQFACRIAAFKRRWIFRFQTMYRNSVAANDEKEHNSPMPTTNA